MEKKSENFSERLNTIKNEIWEAIYNLLKEHNVESINMYAYWSERCCDRCTFFDVDDDGYGVALYIDKLRFFPNLSNLIEFDMLDTNDNCYSTWDNTNFFTVAEANYVLDMLEQIFEVADEEDGGRILKENEDFDDWED